MISIIIPVYNSVSFLSRCIDSIIAQTYSDFELILVDDGSTDNSGELCDKYAEKDYRIKVIHTENNGAASARKKGIDNATGEFTVFVDSDDWIEENELQRMSHLMGCSDILMTGYYWDYNGGSRKIYLNNFTETNYYDEKMNLFYDSMIYSFTKNQVTNIGSLCNNMFVTSKLKIAFENINENINHWEDFYVLVKYLLLCESVSVTDECFYHYNFRNESMSSKKNIGILSEYNILYIELLQEIQNHEYSDVLIRQLNKWFIYIVNSGFEQYYKFDRSIVPPQYVGDFENLSEKRIVLYCAGKCGQNIYDQLMYFGYNVVLWADKAFEQYQKNGINVSSPLEITNIDYDIVYIAVSDNKIAEVIKKDLIDIGVNPEKIIFRMPYKIYG